MPNIIDISMPVKPGMPIWPGSVGIRLTRTSKMEEGDTANVTRLDCDVHVGTHVDAPWHFLEHGLTVEEIPLTALIGEVVVAHLPDVGSITASNLSNLSLPKHITRLLLRTRNSELWERGETTFKEDYVALTADAAQWVVDHNIQLIGIDYLSVQRYRDSPMTHKILLKNSVVVVEGLILAQVQPGIYELICLPLLLTGTEGAPARAILRTTIGVND